MEDYNSDELEHPTWLNEEFFKNALRTYEKDDTIKISNLKITPGSGKGDHLASIMFRAVVEYSSRTNPTNSRSMIVKTIPEAEGFKKDFLENSTVFKTEIGMYSEELPKFEEVLRKNGDNTQLCAKMIYHSLTPHKVVVFEDLLPLGYSCISGRRPNVDEVKACLSKLAKLHGVSYKLAMEGDESVKQYQDGILRKPKEELQEFISGGLQRLINALSKLPEFEIYVEKLQAVEATLIDKCNQLYTAHQRYNKSILVLNHGDFHSKNVMFKYDKDNKLEDVLLVDFQMSCYAPSIIDITYGIFMLLDEDMRSNYREEMIRFYFSSFLETLQNIGYAGELPSLPDFYIDMYKYKEFELWVMSTFLPFMYALSDPNKEKVELGAVVSSNDALSSLYTHPGLLNELRLLLPRYLHKGYLG